jgi:hypothetical protein
VLTERHSNYTNTILLSHNLKASESVKNIIRYIVHGYSLKEAGAALNLTNVYADFYTFSRNKFRNNDIFLTSIKLFENSDLTQLKIGAPLFDSIYMSNATKLVAPKSNVTGIFTLAQSNVLRLAINGLTREQIAAEMNIGMNTLQGHIKGDGQRGKLNSLGILGNIQREFGERPGSLLAAVMLLVRAGVIVQIPVEKTKD